MVRSFFVICCKFFIFTLCSFTLLHAQTIQVSWSRNPEPDVKYYGIYRASSTHTETEIARIPGTETVFLDSDIQLGHIYYYRIVAVDLAGNASEFSDMVEIIADISSITDIPETFPTEFELRQNYPNPFNPTTTFTFAVAEAAHVSLVIYDALGRQIRRLVDETKEPGMYDVVWDARDDVGHAVATGIYFAQFEGGAFKEVRKLVLRK